MLKKLLMMAVFMAFGPTYAAEHSVADAPPVRFNSPPRILFNLNDSKDSLDELVPEKLYQNWWQGINFSMIRGDMRSKKGEVFQFTPAFHGEEFILLLEGRITFEFLATGESLTMNAGDVLHFNNVEHKGVCETTNCYYFAIMTPFLRDEIGSGDYGEKEEVWNKESKVKSQ